MMHITYKPTAVLYQMLNRASEDGDEFLADAILDELEKRDEQDAANAGAMNGVAPEYDRP